MLTLDKLKVYQHFGGSIDGWARATNVGDDSGITDGDWFLIDELRQGLALIATGQASQAFTASLESRLLDTTADEATRQALLALR